MTVLPMVQDIVIPLLQNKLIPGKAAMVSDWKSDIANTDWPLILVKRLGGVRHATRPTQLAMPIIELSVFTKVDKYTTDRLYEDALDVLFDAVRLQTLSDAGYLHSMKELQGPIDVASPYEDSWRVQGLIQFGVRPPQSA